MNSSRKNGRLFRDEGKEKERLEYERTEIATSGKLYGTLHCNRCYKPTLIVIEVGDDGYRLDRVESNCKHIPEKKVVKDG